MKARAGTRSLRRRMLLVGVLDTGVLVVAATALVLLTMRASERLGRATDEISEEQRIAEVIHGGITRQLMQTTAALSPLGGGAGGQAEREAFLASGRTVHMGIRRFLFRDLSTDQRIELEHMREEHQLFEVAAVQSMEMLRQGMADQGDNSLAAMTLHANLFLEAVDRFVDMREREFEAFRTRQAETFKRLYRAAGAVGLLVLLSSVALAWRMHRRVTRPLEELARAAERMGSGDLAARVPPGGDAEFALLAGGFNRMAENLEAATRSLERRNQELEEALEKVQTTQAELIQLEKLGAIGRMTAGFAHEINNPLTSVVGYSQLLSDRLGSGPPPTPDEMRADFLDPVLHEASRARHLVRNLLEISRRPAGATTPVDVARAFEVVTTLRAYAFQQAGLRLVVDAPGDVYVLAEPQMLQGMLLNLVNNAMDAMAPQGGGRLTVHARADERFVHMVIEDEGPGLPNTDRIFEPFFTTKAPGQGTGLGLAMVHRFAHAFGGTVRAENVAGGGARFTVTLPRAERPSATDETDVTEVEATGVASGVGGSASGPEAGKPRAEAEVASPSAAAGSAPIPDGSAAPHAGANGRGPPGIARAGSGGATPALRALRVLVVDDEPHVRRLQQRILGSIHADVLLAESVPAARAILEGEAVDLVVSDIRMPGESGLDLYRWVEANAAELAGRFLFVSGDISDPALLDMSRREPDRFIHKPFRIHDYLERVQSMAAEG